MNGRTQKRARVRAKEIRDAMDRKARSERRVPLWRRAAYRVGWRGPQRRWIDKWEAGHAIALRIATKKLVQMMTKEATDART
jgi:hypothetical protein